MDSTSIEVRPLAARDSIDALTAVLHRSYAPLAALGRPVPALDLVALLQAEATPAS